MGSLLSSDKGPSLMTNNSSNGMQESIQNSSNNNAATFDASSTSTSSSDLQLTTPMTSESPFDLSPSDLNKTLLFNTTSTPNTTNSTEDGFSIEIFGTYFYPLRWITIQSLKSSIGPLSSLAMIICCVLPYVPQYITIYKNQSSHGFSTYVCLTLLIANILRIAFWFGHRFELPLLVQSVIMIIAQLLLLELCVRVKRRCLENKKSFYPLTQSSSRISTSSTRRKTWASSFWRWKNFLSYIVFLCSITLLLAIPMYFLSDNALFVESIGLCALVTESMLGLPQVLKNFSNKSVEGMSLMMVLMWLAGDGFKTGYFIINAVPYQFWLCGLLQITIDLLILFQVCLYKRSF